MRMILLLLLFSNGVLLSQNSNPSPVFIQLAQVDLAPVFPGCESPDLTNCSLEKISSYFIENLDETLLRSLTPGEDVAILRFIVDRDGKVRNAKVQTKSEDLKIAGVNILKELPDFKPGVHEGEKANVIVDLPIKLETTLPVSNNSDLYDSQAMAMNCKKKKDPKICTTEFVQKFFHKNVKDLDIKTDGAWLKAVIKFTIDEEGKVTNVFALGINEDFNQEGIRVIKGLPEFIPAIRDGKNVAMDFSLPIMISTN